MDLRQFVESAVVATIGGALTGAADALTVQPVNWRSVVSAAGIGAIVTLAALYRNRPGLKK